ncbi:MAG: hypothetical protein P8J20_12920 [Novosphingobium sp.]|nr:hypothetical protein [Novosphingobium sp.]
MSIANEALAMANDPPEYFGYSGAEAHRLPREDWQAMQLAAFQQRFADLKERLPVLTSTSGEMGIDGIEKIEDGANLLFPHTVYKSYPVSLLEKNRFRQLTKWLSRLTTIDLSEADVDHCESIDAWLAALEDGVGLSVTHSSGTGGTMSFLPRTSDGYRIISDVFGMASRESNGIDNDQRNVPWHTFYLGFRGGRSHAARAGGWAYDNFAHSPEFFHTLYDADMSSDVMFMAARVRLAEARGEVDRLEVSPAMKARQAEFAETQRRSAEALDRIFEQMIALRGERVYIGGMNGAMTELAQRGLAQGYRGTFGPECIVQCGGGNKGGLLPDNWAELSLEFTGAKQIAQYYGMTEVTMIASMCSEGHYHIPPWVVAYVLDPDTGEEKPREGVQTGRAAFFDLVPQTYWGGFASGDEITLDFSPCKCGRTTYHAHPQIQRFSEMRGGDDKITCAAADDAHAAAIEILALG